MQDVNVMIHTMLAEGTVRQTEKREESAQRKKQRAPFINSPSERKFCIFPFFGFQSGALT
jgi:hypothetical protein